MATIEELLKQYDELQARVDEPQLRKQFDALGRSLRAAVDEMQAAAEEGATTSVRPIDLAKSFRDVMGAIQAEAREAEEVGVTIRAMDLEVKGLVEATEKDTTLVLPSTSAGIDPNALSTLRVSFSTIPTARAEESPVEPPR
jgi:hypothetical protein